ncbi:DUF7522 family protein [Halobacterium litoreum]|uniref:Uncharacterized protein n=1 Tax=Halobacterium litoreum TaxID=2039234 RepID=A0ABD5NFI9_9EURY|nr:hypothetical protein [Halobacterium litoreum]UHH13489.1 hypothetical protein LT972_00490 [Halobacterium litoreum]
MTDDEALVEFVRDAAADRLRGVVRYHEDDYRFLYEREDAGWGPSETADVERFVDQFRHAELDEVERTHLLNVGNHHATVRLYDGAVVIHFPQGEGVGTLVSLDPEAASDLATFVSSCLGHLYRDSPQVVENAPDW